MCMYLIVLRIEQFLLLHTEVAAVPALKGGSLFHQKTFPNALLQTNK